MWNEFKAFAIKGNIMDLAIGVIIGGAFGKIVTSLVTDVLTPLIGILLGGLSFKDLSINVGSEAIKYGLFLQSVVDFLIISASIFLIMKALISFKKKEEAAPAALPAPTTEEVLLAEIRDLLKAGHK